MGLYLLLVVFAAGWSDFFVSSQLPDKLADSTIEQSCRTPGKVMAFSDCDMVCLITFPTGNVSVLEKIFSN